MAAPAAPQSRPLQGSRIARGTPLPALQAKLQVGAANDRHEREADRVAAQVMQGGEAAMAIPPSISPLGTSAPGTSPVGAQRKTGPAPRKDEDRGRGARKVQRKAMPHTEEETPAGTGRRAQRKGSAGGDRLQRDAAAGAAGGMAGAPVESRIAALQASAAPGLDPATRGFMESRFGRDFGDVRLHTGPRAAATAEALGARAFTVGRDIVFNAGQYRPQAGSGRLLLAHELTHTVQQAGGGAAASRSRLQRMTREEEAAAEARANAARGGDAATAAPTSFDVPSMPGARVDVANAGGAKGTITVPTLGLPKFGKGHKGIAGGPATPKSVRGEDGVPQLGKALKFTAPMPHRDKESVPSQVWTSGAQDRASVPAGVQAALQARIDATPGTFSFAEPDGAPVHYFKLAKGGLNQIFIGTLAELAASDALLRPQWSQDGTPLFDTRRFDADHFLEMQIGGADEIGNMWLLEASYNRSVGSQLATNIRTDVTRIITEAQALITDPDEEPAGYKQVQKEWNIEFSQVVEGSNFSTARAAFWTLDQIGQGDHVAALQPLTEAQLVEAGIRPKPGQQPQVIRVFPSAAGGWARTLKLGAKGNVLPPPASDFRERGELFKGIRIVSGTYTGATDVAAANADIATLRVEVLRTHDDEGKEVIERRRGDITVKSAPRLGIAGYVTRESIMAAARTTRFKSLSPLTFSDLGVTPEGVLSGIGTVGSTKLMLPGLNVPLSLYGDRIGMDFPVPVENLSLGPVTVTEAGLSLGVGGQGFFVEGYAGFEIRSLGSGLLAATLTEGGPELSGQFALAMDFLNPAEIAATYRLADDSFSAEATLGVQEGRLPGVESGTVTVGLTRDTVSVAGTLTLGGALRGTVVSVTYSQTEGLAIGADNIPLPFASLPAVQNATLSVHARRAPDATGWTVAGQGSATLAVPGATGSLAIDYLDGAVTIHGTGAVARGPASGTLDFTATNRPIDAEGRAVDGPLSDGLTAWGRGTVTVAFGELLTGTAGIELTPDNRVVISGTIAMPPVYEVFARRDFTRDIFTLSPPEFPIWGVSVAGYGVGVFAFVDARVFFEAFVGPGEIRDAAVTATLDLDRPEDAVVQGHGEFHVPAYAGLGLDVGGGLRARLAVAYAQGRVGLTGRLGIEAAAGAAVDFDWSRAAGLALSADLHAEATPKFDLAATASVTVGVDLLVDTVEETWGPWSRQLGSFGPDMTLGVRMPVRWSEAGGLDLSLDNIVVTRPDLDAPALMADVFDRLAG